MGNSYSIKEIPRIETGRIILRELFLSDVDDIFEYASDPEINVFLPWETHKSKDDSAEFVKKTKENFENLESIDWGIELKDSAKIIGAIGIRKFNDENKCGDVGYVLSKDYWGKGFSTEALKAVIEFGFEKLNMNRIEAHCDEDNVASYKVMEKAGMKCEGTLRQKVFIKGKFVNMKFYSILRTEFFNKP